MPKQKNSILLSIFYCIIGIYTFSRDITSQSPRSKPHYLNAKLNYKQIERINLNMNKDIFNFEFLNFNRPINDY